MTNDERLAFLEMEVEQLRQDRDVMIREQMKLQRQLETQARLIEALRAQRKEEGDGTWVD